MSADRPLPYSQMRPGHADRDKVIDRLQEAFADGRLADEEYDERLQRALSAKTFGELAALTRDIPGERLPQPMSGRFPVPVARRPDLHPVASAALGVAGFVLFLGPLAWIPASWWDTRPYVGCPRPTTVAPWPSSVWRFHGPGWH